MKEQKYLPLGSVVKVRGGVQKFMIITRGVVLEVDNRKALVDYGGCIFPDGVVNDKVIYFNHEDIDEILYTGYSDELDRRMTDNIKKAEQQTKIEHLNIRAIQEQYEKEQGEEKRDG